MNLAFRYAETAEFFGEWLLDADGADAPVSMDDLDFQYFHNAWNIPEEPYSEYALLAYKVCNHLLKSGACIFHGAAFKWHEKAFIFTAPSGTGKSTQLNNWFKLYQDEIQIMNGDKPLLKIDNNRCLVMPSPWKGKEKMGIDSLSAELGGIIILRQGNINELQKLQPYESVPQLLQRILFSVENRDQVILASKILETVITTVPVWKLINTGDMNSSILTHDEIKKELGL